MKFLLTKLGMQIKVAANVQTQLKLILVSLSETKHDILAVS